MSRYIVYTDGSSSNNNDPSLRVGAFAAVIFAQFNGQTCKKDVSGTVAGATNNQMELTAVVEALKTVIAIDPRDTPEVSIHSDSQYVITGATKWIEGWKANDWKTGDKQDVKNQELWLSLDRLLGKTKYTFLKVKGDGNDKWNKYCDVKARSLSGSKPK